MRRALLLFIAVSLAASIAVTPLTGTQAAASNALFKQWQSGEWQIKALLTSAAATAPQTSALLEPWARLVYSTYIDSNYEIFINTLEQGPFGINSFTRNITQNKFVDDTHPRLSPDATQVVFVSSPNGNQDIYRVGIDGTNMLRLTNVAAIDTQPAWDPTGRQLVFTSFRDGNWNLYRMEADGSNPTALTSDLANDVMPSWSPDGTQIAWVRVGANTGAIWVMKSDGSAASQITADIPYLQHPNWSPDGSQLSFDADFNGDGLNEPAVIAADGSGLQQMPVTNNSGDGTLLEVTANGWSPEGDRILVNNMYYTVTGNEITIKYSYLGRIVVATNISQGLGSVGIAFQPDLRSIDLIAPTSALTYIDRTTRGDRVALSWSGRDTGVAQEVIYDLQYRVGAGAWTPLLTRTIEYSAEYIGTLGETVAFRIRARDDAGNTEAWRTVPDATTTFYQARLVGRITDNRGYPLPDVSVGITPAAIELPGPASAANGLYAALLQSQAARVVTATDGAYGPVPGTTLSFETDRSFSPYLPPGDSRIQNGQFEASPATPSGWTTAGTLLPAITSQVATGARALQIGQECGLPCLDAATTVSIPQDSGAGKPVLQAATIGADGTLHVLWSRMRFTIPSNYGLYYQSRSPAGVWEPAIQVGDGYRAQLAIDGQGNVHAAWFTAQNLLQYRQKPIGGSWSAIDELGNADSALQLLADSQGQLYLFYGCSSAFICSTSTGVTSLRVRANGAWQAAVPLWAGSISAAIDSQDHVWVLWNIATNQFLARLSPSGIRSDLQGWPTGYVAPSTFHAQFDAQDRLHLVWSDGTLLHYNAQLADRSFGPAQPIGPGYQSYLSLAGDGTLYLAVAQPPNTFQPAQLFRRPAGGPWSAGASLGTDEPAIVAGSGSGGALVLYGIPSFNPVDQSALAVRATSLVGSAGAGSLAQSFTIPADMHQPTLAFTYLLNGVGTGSGSRFDVSVTDGLNTTSLFSGATGGDWQQASFDLSQWAGKTISVTFTLTQAANTPAARVVVDDISAGSWLTPVITDLALAQPQAPFGSALTITGANFLGIPQVQLNDRTLADVTVINSGTLQVIIPADLPPGRYTLKVINPAGQRAWRADLLLGSQVFLPLIQR